MFKFSSKTNLNLFALLISLTSAVPPSLRTVPLESEVWLSEDTILSAFENQFPSCLVILSLQRESVTSQVRVFMKVHWPPFLGESLLEELKHITSSLGKMFCNPQS